MLNIEHSFSASEFNPYRFPQDFMSSSTILLRTTLPHGAKTGTGFFYTVFHPQDPTKCRQVVITNKHVLEGGSLRLAFFTLDKDGKPNIHGQREPVVIPNPFSVAIKHPDDKVDLCAILITDVIERYAGLGKKFYFSAYTNAMLADKDIYDSLRQLDCVVMVGYPAGLEGEVNIQPIFRRGTLATNPSLDFGGRKEFVLDIPNFGGSSGSPVLLFDEGCHKPHTGGGVDIRLGTRFKLLGVNYATYETTNQGIFLEAGTNRNDIAVYSKAPINTAFVINAEKLRELVKIIQDY